MSFRRIAIVQPIVLAAILTAPSQTVWAQSSSTDGTAHTATTIPSPQGATKIKPSVETSFSVGAMAQLAASRINDTNTSLTTERLTPSAGVFATFRQSFRPWFGYSVNFGYNYPTYHYTYSASGPSIIAPSKASVQASMYEISVSYIAQKHLTSRFSLFGEAGAGTIAFSASNNGGYLPNRSNEFRPEGILGFGADYHLAHGFGLRAQYRGLFVRYPYPNDGISPRLKTLISEPTLSLTYTFGKHSHR